MANPHSKREWGLIGSFYRIRKLLLIPVVPDILDIVVAFEHFQQLGHVLDVILAGQLHVVLGKKT